MKTSFLCTHHHATKSGAALRWLASALACGAAILAAGLSLAADTATNPITIEAGPDWIPLQAELDIVPGSALDFSGMGFTERPAGKHGRVIARADGQFAFENTPEKARRFYGINLCFGAHYLSKPEAERLARRLSLLGYNALRIHHYERDLVQGQKQSTVLNPEKLDQFDYLCAVLIEHGIYLTTDIYVSRPVPYREVGIDRNGMIPMDTFKILVPVHTGAFENWKQFARAFLGHTNAYTQRSYAREPALAWLAMINEGNIGNFHRDILTIPEWKQAWNKWLGTRYGSRQGLAKAWGSELKEGEDPEPGSVALPERLQTDGLRARDCIAFYSETERGMVLKMKQFLREELNCHALVSNASSWTRFTTDQQARDIYDYVDDHFYVDHPQFLEGSWRLPSRCPNTSPLAEGAAGGRTITFTRLFDKPFTLTEYNYSGPGRFRGVGGILTGAMGALQGWGGIWRFAYSHGRNAMFTPSNMGYFDVASDPLSQAAERASLCLFLREDLEMAPHSVGLVMTESDLQHPPAKIPTLAPKWHWLAWVTRVGTDVVPSPAARFPESFLLPLGWHTPASDYPAKQRLDLNPYTLEPAQLVSALRERSLFKPEDAPRPNDKFFRSETRQVTIDGPRDQLVLETPRTAGGYSRAGEGISTTQVRFSLEGSDATVWVSSLDSNPIRRSERLLVTHLTDLQNTGIKYAEPARQTLLAWGKLPHLVRAGKAHITLQLASPGKYRVYALSPGGQRMADVPVRVNGDALEFTADVAADVKGGARMLYEVATK